MSRREFDTKTKKEALLRSGGQCEASGPRYGYPAGHRCCAPLKFGKIFDHDTPDALGGEPTLENCRVICLKCNKHKTGKTDIPQIAKTERQFLKDNGLWRKSSRGFGRPREMWQPSIPRDDGDRDGT